MKVEGGEGAYGVGSNVNALLLAVVDKLRALEERVTLDLVGSGNDTSGVNDSVEVGNDEVGDADGAGLGLGQLGHGLPGVDDGDGVVDFDVAAGEGRALDEGEELAAGLEGDGPVDEVQVEVVEFQLRETLVEGFFDDLGVVLAVPELGCLCSTCVRGCVLRGDEFTYDEDILALEAGDVGVGTLNAHSDFLLVLVAVDGSVCVCGVWCGCAVHGGQILRQSVAVS